MSEKFLIKNFDREVKLTESDEKNIEEAVEIWREMIKISEIAEDIKKRYLDAIDFFEEEFEVGFSLGLDKLCKVTIENLEDISKDTDSQELCEDLKNDILLLLKNCRKHL